MKKVLKSLTVKEWMIYISVFLIPIIVLLIFKKGIDNDIWYLLAEGRYIINHGIYHVDTLSIHTGLDIVVQNWLSAVIFWILYTFLGSNGLYFTIIIVNIVICFLLYKISMLISDKNKILSLLVVLFTDSSLCLYFIVTRPQIFSFIIYLIAIYLMELYIKTDNKKYLYYLPLLSFIEINLHASLWLMLMLIMIPYLIDSFKCDKLKLQGYRQKPLFISFIVSLLVGFINPYGYKAITFIFTSYGDPYMLNYISELQPFNIKSIIGVHLFSIILITALLTVFFREEKIRIRYICLYCGTLILGMVSIKGFSHFILLSIFPIAYLLKDRVPKDCSNAKKWFKKLSNFLVPLIGLSCITLVIYFYSVNKDSTKLVHIADDAVSVIDFFTDGTGNKDVKVYASFNNGGYVEFRGYKAYIDPRAEVFLKINNHKADIHSEYYDFEFGKIDRDEFLKKYDFDYLLVDVTDRLYQDMDLDNYFVIYDDINTLYKVYAKNNIVSDDLRKMLVEEYNKQLIKMEDLINNNNK